MFPFTYSRRMMFEVEDPPSAAAKVRGVLIEELRARKGRVFKAQKDTVAFRGGVFRLVTGWNLLASICRGEIRVTPCEGKLLVAYPSG